MSNLQITLPNGSQLPKIGLGSWYLGSKPEQSVQEIKALQTGLDLGMNLIDTAEMYGSGDSERLIGKAIATVPRDSFALVSKVYPQNAGKKLLEKSLTQSLKNLGTDYLDLYLLHWRGAIPFSETIEEMEKQVEKGTIRGWGVSNLDISDMKELLSATKGTHCQVNQVLYHLGSRGVESHLLPYLQQQNIPLMAYCPLAQGGDLKRGLLEHPTVQTLGKSHNVSPMVILLAFAILEEGVFAIPKAGNPEHVKENAKALTLTFSEEEVALLRKSFPNVTKKEPLDIV